MSAGLVFPPSWRSFSAIQGGLVVGHLLDAAVSAATAATPATAGSGTGPAATVLPRAVTAHLVGPVAADRLATLSTRQDKKGATSSTRAEMWQDGRLRALAQVLTSTNRPGTPSLPPWAPSTAATSRPADGLAFNLPADFVPIAEHLEIRALDGTLPTGTSRDPWLHAWVRLRPSAAALAPLVGLSVLIDALPPSVFATHAPVALATVEVSAHLWQVPDSATAWTRIDQRTAWVSTDVLVDDVVLHDENGVMLCTARQTRRIPTSATE